MARDYSKPQPKAKPVKARIPCLKCDKKFNSKDKVKERICGPCCVSNKDLEFGEGDYQFYYSHF